MTELGLHLEDMQIERALTYLELLQKWNKVYNLTSVRDPLAMLSQHLLDSFSVLRPIPQRAPAARRILDVGSGAGLPGVVLALACPELEVTCLDAVAKKTAFVQQVASTLGLGNLLARHARVETMSDMPGWDLICSRAFANLADFVAGSAQLLAPGGVWMAMKGQLPTTEIEDLPESVEVFHVEHLQVPFLDAQRCLIWMRKTPA